MTNIYILDDEEQVADLMNTFVMRLGFNVRTYTSGHLFLEQWSDDDSECILILDLNMPNMDGIEVIRRLAELDAHISLILISGYDTSVLHSAEILAQAHDLHVIASLTKPVHFGTLKSLLAEYSGTKKAVKAGDEEWVVSVEELERAMKNRELLLHFQPQIDIPSNSLAGFEALLRWQHPERGLIYPNQFVPIAEANKLMGQLTNYVIDDAVGHMEDWRASGLMIPVSVNVSADNITSLTLPEQLTQLFREKQADPALLVLEITESAVMGELVTSLDILTRLRMKGFDLSIDDFGTGYSSLSQLHKIPFTELKIDRSFVMNMARDEEARAIVRTCIMLGHELKMTVVAEGVESEESLNLLNEMGCNTAQGYHIARPMPAGEVLAWASQWSEQQSA